MITRRDRAEFPGHTPFLPVNTGYRCIFVLALLFLTLGYGWRGFSQTTVLTEGFETVFPGAWSTGDTNASGTPAYWKDVSAFGTVGAHSGNWKGYCAGIGFGGTTANPLYQNNMGAFMTQSVNLAGFSGANLGF